MVAAAVSPSMPCGRLRGAVRRRCACVAGSSLGIGDDLWRELARLFGQQGDIAARRQRHHAKVLGKARTTSRVCRPMEPVLPNTVIPCRESAVSVIALCILHPTFRGARNSWSAPRQIISQRRGLAPQHV